MIDVLITTFAMMIMMTLVIRKNRFYISAACSRQ